MEVVKKRLCYVAQDCEEELLYLTEGNVKEKKYELSKVLKIGEERFKCPETLFKPSILGKDDQSIHKAVFNSIMKSDETTRKDLFQIIVFNIDSTMFEVITKRICKEIVALTRETVIKVLRELASRIEE